ncbi:putative 2OG-Fe(II) oxygenase [Candidatus Pelagibacter sp.]|nr:putative 2OG-Fe(II) oxygenase [Candidatus Pelagibacter sp.]
MLIKKKGKIFSPYIITEFLSHIKLKDELINLIEETDKSKPLTIPVNTVSKCDFDWSKDTDRPYFKKLINDLSEHLKKLFIHLGFGALEIKNLWFQRYITNDIHDWHVHGDCQWTGVYYLELPKDDSLKTQVIQPYDQRSKIDMDVKEGDIILFPSHCLHRAPRNNTTKRKIIISFNIDALILDGQYPEDYKTNENKII